MEQRNKRKCEVIVKVLGAVALSAAGLGMELCGQDGYAGLEVGALAGSAVEGAWHIWNGVDGSGGLTWAGIRYANAYNTQWGSWSGFAFSDVVDTQTRGWGNQYAAYAGGGVGGASAYAVGYAPSELSVVGAERIVGVWVGNTTYAAWSMLEGDAFARRFGDDPATEEVVETGHPDWFKVEIVGLDIAGQEVGRVAHYLADYRFEADAEDYVQDSWAYVDLSGLSSGARSLRFELSSSDVGAFGMNTPGYFALGGVHTEAVATWMGYVVEPSGWVNTGEWMGWVYPSGDYLWIARLGRYAYTAQGADAGLWIYLTR